MQMLEVKGRIIVYNLFNSNNDWSNVHLDQESVLFKTFVIVKPFFSRSRVFVQRNIAPLLSNNFPKTWISSGGGNRKIKLWEGTIIERELIINGTGNNLLVKEGSEPSETEYTPIDNADYEKVKHLELTALRIYPEFNERLYLCFEFGVNYDPLKELSFNRTLPEKCITYVDIIAGKIKLADLGY